MIIMKKSLLQSHKLFLLFSYLIAGQTFSQQPLLDPVSHPKFVNVLPLPSVMQPVSPGYYEVYIQPTKQDLGLNLKDAEGQPILTNVWGYGPALEVSYRGPTIEAVSGETIRVKWINNLPKEHLFAIDETIHWAGNDMDGNLPPPTESFNGIPAVAHLHGGHTDADSDGHPEAWYTPEFLYTGSQFYDNLGLFTYDNSQEAATLWYHDHTIGITRLNVYAGLAGFYLLRDQHENSLNLPKDQHVDLNDENSPMEHFEIPIAIQDRSFTADGQLYYPTEIFSGINETDGSQEIIYNSILPEMFGDFILVNGKTWPYLNVQPRKYRLRLLNGSDSRFYELKIPGVNFYQIGSDGGFLQAPAKRNTLTIGPGERIDVIVDFSAPQLWGQTLIMRNTARSPFPFGITVNPQTTGQIMAFNVVTPLTNPDTSVISPVLRPASFSVQGESQETRQLVLFEEMDKYGRLLPSLGTLEKGPLSFTDLLTENPELNTAETWEIYNTTVDAHPIHLHLVHFQVINTQKFNVRRSVFGKGEDSKVQLIGNPLPPASENAGPKDTFIVYPGEVARVKAIFDKEGEYVWHCHILSHEDHDMMRPFYVGDYAAPKLADHMMIQAPELLDILVIAPNPVQDMAQIRFRMKADAAVILQVHDFTGKIVSILHDGVAAANTDYEVMFDRSGLPSGLYICRLITRDGQSFEKVIMAK